MASDGAHWHPVQQMQECYSLAIVKCSPADALSFMRAFPPAPPTNHQAQQALIAAQQAAANAPPKQVEGWVPTRCISDLFAGSSSEPMTPSGAGSTAGGGVSPLEGCRLAFLGVAKFQEFSPLLSTGPHLAVPHLDQAAGDLLSLTTG